LVNTFIEMRVNIDLSKETWEEVIQGLEFQKLVLALKFTATTSLQEKAKIRKKIEEIAHYALQIEIEIQKIGDWMRYIP